MFPNDEIRHDGMHALTVTYFNLSDIDFLDCPAVTVTCRLPYSCTTKDASSNEYINPELWTINRPIFILGALHIAYEEGCEALSPRQSSRAKNDEKSHF